MKRTTIDGGSRQRHHTDRTTLRRFPRIAVAAIAAVGISLAPPLTASASTPSEPAGTTDTAPSSGSSGGSNSSGGSSNYSPPALNPVALIGAGALVVIAIVWTVRSGRRRSSPDSSSVTNDVTRNGGGAPPMVGDPGQTLGAAPPNDLSSE